jgi:hypothetical protein
VALALELVPRLIIAFGGIRLATKGEKQSLKIHAYPPSQLNAGILQEIP